MRWALVVVAVLCASPARGDAVRLQWPLRPPPAVMRAFDAPSPNWNRGHRGVDLAGKPGQPVYAAGTATVVYAGTLAGRQLVSLAHPGGLRTSYEPVEAAVRVGQRVAAGTPIGALVAGHLGCPAAACLHWGAMWGPAARADYVDPLGLLASTPIRLKPLHGQGLHSSHSSTREFWGHFLPASPRQLSGCRCEAGTSATALRSDGSDGCDACAQARG